MPLGPYNRWTPGRVSNHTTGFLRDLPSPLSSQKVARPKKNENENEKELETSDAPGTLQGVADVQQGLRSPTLSSGRPTRKHHRTKSQCGQDQKASSKNVPSFTSIKITLWDWIVFVLFWASVLWLFRALAGFGSPDDDTHASPSSHVDHQTLDSRHRPSSGKGNSRAIMVDWQGDYNILPEHYARRPQTTSSLYLQPEYNLPAPTPSATPDSDYKLASPVAPFYDPRYDPFDLQERLFGDLQGYDTNGKPYALKVHLKPTQVSASSYGGQTTIAKCRGARTRC